MKAHGDFTQINLTSLLDVVFITLFLIIITMDGNTDEKVAKAQEEVDSAKIAVGMLEATVTAEATRNAATATAVATRHEATREAYSTTATGDLATRAAYATEVAKTQTAVNSANETVRMLKATVTAEATRNAATATSVATKHEATREAYSTTVVKALATRTAYATQVAKVEQSFATQLQELEKVLADPFAASVKAEMFNEFVRSYTIKLSPVEKATSQLTIEESKNFCEIFVKGDIADCLNEKLFKHGEQLVVVILIHSAESSDEHIKWLQDYLIESGFTVRTKLAAKEQAESRSEHENS